VKLSTFSVESARGWSVEAFPALDSPQTLVVVFGGASFLDTPGPLDDLVAAYPSSVVVGCSSAGEIFGDRISDDSLSRRRRSPEHGSLSRPALTWKGRVVERGGGGLGEAAIGPDPAQCSPF
jgi:hypothetical protein